MPHDRLVRLTDRQRQALRACAATAVEHGEDRRDILARCIQALDSASTTRTLSNDQATPRERTT